jgi:hypothetical protein
LHLDKNIVFITENMFKNNLFKNPYKYLEDKDKNRFLTKKEIKNLEEQGEFYGNIVPMLFSEWKTDIDSIKKFKNRLIKLYEVE